MSEAEVMQPDRGGARKERGRGVGSALRSALASNNAARGRRGSRSVRFVPNAAATSAPASSDTQPVARHAIHDANTNPPRSRGPNIGRAGVTAPVQKPRTTASAQQSSEQRNVRTVSPARAAIRQRFQVLKNDRELERVTAIKNGFLADPERPRTLAEAITPVGTCQDMCPEFERVERICQNDVWGPEYDTTTGQSPEEGRMVKKFRRAAAGIDEQLPSDLRPPLVLQKTIDYVFNTVVGQAQSLASVHHFVWDRTRAVRNDFSIQQLTKVADLRIAIDCYERISRFHILSLHQLAVSEKAYDKYDAQQEREQLDKTLLSLMQYYDDSRSRVVSPNEAEFRAYCIIFQIQDPMPDLEDRVQTWPFDIVKNSRVQCALKIYAAASNTVDPQGPLKPRTMHSIAQANWRRFWLLIESNQTSYLMACVAEIYFDVVRRTALNAIWQAHRPGGQIKSEDWTLTELIKPLGLADEGEVQAFCEDYGFHIGRRADQSPYLDLNSIDGRKLPQPSRRQHQQLSSLVERKRHNRTLPAVINGLSVRAAQHNGQIQKVPKGDAKDCDQPEEDSLFLPSEERKSPTRLQAESNNAEEIISTTSKAHRFSGQPSPQQKAPEIQSFISSDSRPAPPFTSSPAFNPLNVAGDAEQPASSAPLDSPNKGKMLFPLMPSSQQPSNELTAHNIMGTTNNAPAFNISHPSTGEDKTVQAWLSKAQSSNLQTTAAVKSSAAAFNSDLSTPFVRPMIQQGLPGDSITLGVNVSPITDERTNASGSTYSPSTTGFTSIQAQPRVDCLARTAVVENSSKAITPPFLFPSIPPPQTAGEKADIANASPLAFPFNSSPVSSRSTLPQPLSSSPKTDHEKSAVIFTLQPPTPPFDSNMQPPHITTSSPGFSQVPQTSPSSLNSSGAQYRLFPSAALRLPIPNSKQAKPPTHAPKLPTVHPPPSVSSIPATSSTTQQTASEAERKAKTSNALDRLATSMVLDPSGLLDQFVEFMAGPLIRDAQQIIHKANMQQEADKFRIHKLMIRYGRRWRETCWNRRLALQGRQRRQRQVQDARARDIRLKDNTMSSHLEAFRNCISSANSPSRGNPKQDMDSLGPPTSIQENQFNNVVNSTSRASNRTDPESIQQRQEHTKTHQPNGLMDKQLSFLSSHRLSPSQSPFNPPRHASRLRQSFLPDDFVASSPPLNSSPARADTTRSTYFRLKAIGLDPRGKTLSSAASTPTPDRKRLRSRESQTFSGSGKRVHIGGPAISNSLQLSDGATSETSASGKTAITLDAEDEELFAGVRAVRDAISESISFFKEEIDKDEMRKSQNSSAGSSASHASPADKSDPSMMSTANTNRPDPVFREPPPKYRNRVSKFLPREMYADVMMKQHREYRRARSPQRHGPRNGWRQLEQVGMEEQPGIAARKLHVNNVPLRSGTKRGQAFESGTSVESGSRSLRSSTSRSPSKRSELHLPIDDEVQGESFSTQLSSAHFHTRQDLQIDPELEDYAQEVTPSQDEDHGSAAQRQDYLLNSSDRHLDSDYVNGQDHTTEEEEGDDFEFGVDELQEPDTGNGYDYQDEYDEDFLDEDSGGEEEVEEEEGSEEDDDEDPDKQEEVRKRQTSTSSWSGKGGTSIEDAIEL